MQVGPERDGPSIVPLELSPGVLADVHHAMVEVDVADFEAEDFRAPPAGESNVARRGVGSPAMSSTLAPLTVSIRIDML